MSGCYIEKRLVGASGGFVTIIRMTENNDSMEVVDVELGDKCYLFWIYFF